MFQNLVRQLREHTRTLVYTEGTDPRILEAASRLKAEGIVEPILVGGQQAVAEAAARYGFDITGIRVCDPAADPQLDEMAEEMSRLRRGRQTVEECRTMLLHGNYYGTMLVKLGRADALLGGATYSTADTVRPALQLVKTRPGLHLVSSSFILVRGDERIAMGDCAINISYEDTLDRDGNVVVSAARKLAEVTVETARMARLFGIEPRVAMLSYSTRGSGKGPGVDLVRAALAEVREMEPALAVDGELQFDAAVSPVVAQTKCKDSPVAGQANTFIFPELQSGNIGYKIAQRLGGFLAFGPLLQGLNAPINDLSRGCNAEEVYQMSIITAAQAL